MVSGVAQKALKAISRLLTLSILLCLILALLPDQKLSPEAQSCLAAASDAPTGTSNGYLLAMGFDAVPGDSAEIVGAERAAKYTSWFRTVTAQGNIIGAANLSYPQQVPDSANGIDIGPLNAMCKPEEKTCLTEYLRTEAAITKFLVRYKVLLARYEELKAKPHFQEVIPASLSQPLPAWAYVTAAQRLLIADSALSILRGQVEHGREQLFNDLLFQRRLLKIAPTLVTKMVAVRMAARDLQLVAELLDAPNGAQALSPSMEKSTPISPSETDMTAAMCNEFRFANAAFILPPNPDSDSTFSWRRISYSMQSYLFKRNATLNLNFKVGASIGAASLGNPTDAMASLLRYDDWHLIYRVPYNPVGMALNAVAPPTYAEYLGRVIDLSGLFRLVELKYKIRLANIRTEKISDFVDTQRSRLWNPYTGGAMSWDGAKQVLYFSGTDSRAWMHQVAVPKPEQDASIKN